MIPLFKVRMSEEAPIRVSETLTSGFIGQGPKVEEFEDVLKATLNTKTRPVTVNSCTTAIDLALELLGVGPGDEVISTPQTCFASQVGSIHRGARIRWADIDPVTGLMDPESASKLITDKTKCIIAVNWAGKLCDYKALKSFGVPVIEDAAHTWDSFFTGEERGDYICYSLQAIKFLTTGDGGIIVCPNEEKEQEARILRWYGLDRTKGETFRSSQNIKRAGFKYHMNDIAATIGLANLPEAHSSVITTRKNTKWLMENINNSNIILPKWDETCSYWLFSMHVIGAKKPTFEKYLMNNGITNSPVHYRNDLYDCTKQFSEKYLPGVTSFDETQVCIPNGWWLTQNDLEYIAQVINDFR